jgi:fucose 4-O-acetylase-like acetyltransferase
VTRRLLFLSGLAIFAIPIQHASAYGLQALFEWTDRYMDVAVPNYDLLGSPTYYVLTVLRQLSVFSVPGFLVISGYFLAFMARGKDQNVSLGSVMPRIRTLIPPFIVWTVIRFGLLRRLPTDIGELLDPYHFIPLLIQFYLLAPLIVPLARRNWKLFLTFFAVLQLSIEAVRYLNQLGVAVPGGEFVLAVSPRWLFYGQQPFWLPFGLVFGLHTNQFIEFMKRNKSRFLAGTMVFGLLSLVEYFVADSINPAVWIGPTFSGFSRNLYIGCALMFLLVLDETKFRFSKNFVEWGSRSLGIYLANIPFIFVVAVFLYRFLPWTLGVQLIYVPALFTAGFFGPLLLMWAVRNSPMRRFYRLVFG